MTEDNKLESWWALTLLALGFAAAVVFVAYGLSFIWPRILDLEALQLLGANVIGVLLAAFFALETERRLGERRERRREDEAQKRRRDEARQALGTLQKVVLHNRQELESVVESLEDHPGEPIFSTADPRAFDPILTRVVETVDDLLLIRQVSTFRHQLEEFNRMAEAQLGLYLHPERHPIKQDKVVDRKGRRAKHLREKLVKKAIQFGIRLSNRAQDLEEDIAARQAELG